MAARITVLWLFLIVIVVGLTLKALGQSSDELNESASPTVTESASDVLQRVRPAIIQIKTFFGANTAEVSHGTGFAIATGGVFITNYHVVAERIQHPEKYRLEYRSADGKTGKVVVLAVDVRHDLAVVKTIGHAPTPLNLTSSIPQKGARAYSVGFPLDVGLTITEGVSNGKVEEVFDSRIHYSGAINGGMSGGPALNEDAKVIGINVSGYLFSQLVSFLVPAQHAVELLDHALKGEKPRAALKQDVVEQMQSHSSELLAALDDPIPTQVSSGYVLPAKLAPFFDCSASGNPTPDKPVQKTKIRCSAKAGLYLQDGFWSGNLTYLHEILTTDKLDPWRFTHWLSKETGATGSYGHRRHVGPFACETSIVGLTGFDASIVICARAYREFEGLHDFTLRVSSLNGATRGFTSHLDLYGVQFDGGMAFIRRFVDSMEWTE